MTVYLFQHQHFIEGVCLPAYFYRSSRGPTAYLRSCALLQFLMTKCQSWTCNAKHSRVLQHNSHCLTFPAPQGIQRRKNAPFFMGKQTSRPTWLFDSMFHKAIKMCSNSHIYISSRLARTTYRAMPQINPLIHIQRFFSYAVEWIICKILNCVSLR